ncbi:chitin-binding protein [Sphaerisporangium melleum]|uniref:Chitin-binding protein n=1 Tax=Sphaerisporangium melleum TaxID=321316 RepID=A0A917VPV1_9ACTN|nr:lytic polysaccharide monooxygenase [Sphaerisporangium melleum]GGL02608.1 chitin-binding protein [Sphaerisporangium melleum]GII69502.1 chitin-binding protein [Sphaerisporangium melleum]
MRKRRKISIAGAAAAIATLLFVALLPGQASAHGAMMMPGSRTYLCWKDAIGPNGAPNPRNPACAAAIAQSGTNSIYNWFAVLRSDGGGRTSGFIPDGKLCSGGAVVYDFSGYDLARTDWPVTHLTAGRNIQFRYNKWAAHPGSFRTYITKDSWSPNRPLAWSDLESTPFYTAQDPASVGSVGTESGYYYWNATLPSNKTGRHIIYSVWQRSDSQETFYNCSDVVFDGGNGEVTGVGDGTGGPSPTPTPTPTVTPTATPTPDTSPTPNNPGGCTATFATLGNWGNGYQGEVTVRNSGSSAISGWTVRWTLPSGTTVNSLWNGSYTVSGSQIAVKNAAHNGSLGSGASTTFGYVAQGSPGSPSLTCSSP